MTLIYPYPIPPPPMTKSLLGTLKGIFKLARNTQKHLEKTVLYWVYCLFITY